MQHNSKRIRTSITLIATVLLVAGVRIAAAQPEQDEKPGTPVETVAGPVVDQLGAAALDTSALDTAELARIDWVEESKKGGLTMIALGLLSVAALAFFLERSLALRVGRFVPRRLRKKLAAVIEERDLAKMREVCQGENSTLGKAGLFIAQHYDRPHDVVTTAIADIAGRDIRNQIAKTSPLSVIAALAPLLGLLGTMIGMIEAFKLVSIYGDDGGASMLADSIAKALITTAGGLVLAIPALAAYHYFRHCINGIANEVEVQLDSLIAATLFQQEPAKQRENPTAVEPQPPNATPAIAPTAAGAN